MGRLPQKHFFEIVLFEFLKIHFVLVVVVVLWVGGVLVVVAYSRLDFYSTGIF